MSTNLASVLLTTRRLLDRMNKCREVSSTRVNRVAAGHATQDTFVNARHSQRLYTAYAGSKDSIMFGGDHDSVRPTSFYQAVCSFFQVALQCPEQLLASDPVPTVR